MTPKQEDALLDYLQEVITPLIEQVLVKKLWQAMSFAKEELIQRKREWQGLTDEEILDVNMSTVTKLIDEPIVCDTDHNIIQLAKAIEAKLKDKNT
jgi:hypothetical protein